MKKLNLWAELFLYLWRVMNPLSVHKELVLVLSFWQVQDGYEVIVAEDTEQHTIRRLQNKKIN